MATCTLDYLINRSNKELEGAHSVVKAKAITLVNQAYNKGIRIAVTSGYRSFLAQAKLYGQGRSKYVYKGVDYGAPDQPDVTGAEPGESMHNYGLAFDVTVFDEHRQPIWGGSAYDEVAKLGKALGLDWGGDWKSRKDRPHYEYTFGLTLKDLQAGKRPPKGVDPARDIVASPSKPVAAKPAPVRAATPDYGGKLIKEGSEGKDVERIQRAVGFKGDDVDGKFGPATEKAVRAYQKRHKLDVDGIVGKQTWEMMF
jgi:hypothetical protein